MLSKHVPDVVLRVFSEYLTESLRSLDTLSGEAVRVLAIGFLGRLLSMTDHVDSRRRLVFTFKISNCYEHKSADIPNAYHDGQLRSDEISERGYGWGDSIDRA